MVYGAYRFIFLGYGRNVNGKCVDVDECSHKEDDCESNSNCVNSIGSYRCECKLGYLQISSYGTAAARCQDIHECITNPCSYPTVCTNTIGSYTCQCEKDLCSNGLWAIDYCMITTMAHM